LKGQLKKCDFITYVEENIEKKDTTTVLIVKKLFLGGTVGGAEIHFCLAGI